MGRTFEEMLEALSPAQRRAVEKRTATLIGEELPLRDLRKAMKLTQTDVPKRSAIEKATNRKPTRRAVA